MSAETYRKRVFCAQLAVGDEVEEVFRVERVERRTGRKGVFLRVSLVDRTGRVTAMVWEEIERFVESLVEGTYARVRGAVERHYRLRQERTTIAPELGKAMSLEDHRAGFASAMAALLAEFNAYLDRPGAMPFDDSVSYRQGVIWMNDDETGEVLEEVRAALARRAANRPGDGRRPRLLSVIQFPSDHS